MPVVAKKPFDLPKSQTAKVARRSRKAVLKPKKMGRPTAYSPTVAQEICAIVAEGKSLAQACEELNIVERTAYRWMFAQPDFRQDLIRARELRGDFSFGEQILDIADNATNDWGETANGKPIVQKELVLRSKLRIEARKFYMERLHRDVWGEKPQTETHVNFNMLSKDELMVKAKELLGMIAFINAPPPQPPPLVYRGEEAPDDDPEPAGIGWQPRPVTGQEG